MSVFRTPKKLKILFIATEAAPFARVGGLGSVMYSLPKALKDLGYDARVMIPRYLSINGNHHLKMEYEDLEVPTGNEEGPEHLICNVKRCDPGPDSEATVTTYFLENQEYYEQRANVYGYADDVVRWAVLSRGTLEFIRRNHNWTPDIIVSSDWQTALVPNYLKTIYAKDPVLSKIASVLTIHNLYYQAMFDHRYVSEMDFDDGHSAIPGFNNFRLEKLNFLRRGIMFADVFNTVSPNYAREIMTEDYGEMLDDLLRERRVFLSGILNGINYEVWDPRTNPHISFPFDVDHLDDRLKNKAILQERFGLPVKPEAFVVAIVSRLNPQKGLNLLFSIADTLLQELPMQLVVVGEGDSDFMSFFHNLEVRHPDQVATNLKFDTALPFLVFSGADIALVPSKFEPCGLTQMEAMRMGCIPIARKTGGLTDSVEDYDPDHGTGTGFVFERFDHNSLMITMVRAFENFRDKKKWRALQHRAMKQDFSWHNSAKKYVDLFSRAVEIHHSK
ncbi:MAG: glycogen synthase [Candidatus Vogelbacteria bacterium CG10_big_fil_rev_8_21_14_0_10_49_38]|uniref:Glycogen synthase n=1 Tax=Candidatus Vogelbacteria bacterium CG10_big_fil_rev_8_21_14_0_10_49_38 TaxID=1975043 RepID=A0A2H0RIA4_9BACT|nr:MAG: glycogen synthase [Candidatus Vogelbacteria bacterium CG10_big_fil_rev_8_21_14_0_10_49_38]